METALVVVVVVRCPAICWSVLLIDDPLEPALPSPIMMGKPSFDLIVLTESHFLPGVCSRLTKCDLALGEIHRPLGTNIHGNSVLGAPQNFNEETGLLSHELCNLGSLKPLWDSHFFSTKW